MYGPLIGLVPTILLIQNSTNFDDVISMYRSDLPTPKIFDHELPQWRMHFSFKDGCLPNSIVSALKECDQFSSPNIHVLLRKAATIQVTNCECEGSFPTLRGLNTYNRASMGLERLLSLALLILHPRRMEMQNMVFG